MDWARAVSMKAQRMGCMGLSEGSGRDNLWRVSRDHSHKASSSTLEQQNTGSVML